MYRVCNPYRAPNYHTTHAYICQNQLVPKCPPSDCTLVVCPESKRYEVVYEEGVESCEIVKLLVSPDSLNTVVLLSVKPSVMFVPSGY